MKMSEAEDIISGKATRSGYCVAFEVRERGMLRSDHFPDVREGEPAIATVDEAWKLAEQFARAKHRNEVINVYVIDAHDFTPVAGYADRMLNEYWKDPIAAAGRQDTEMAYEICKRCIDQYLRR